jgi:hypothetical protein
MKTRSSFVSNSSSSSFVVVFPYRPQSQAELQELMFPNAVKEICLWGDLEETTPTDTIVEHVWNDIQKYMEKSFAPEELLECMGFVMPEEYLNQIPLPWTNYKDLTEKERKKAYDVYSKKCNKIKSAWAKKTLENIYQANPNAFIFPVSYSDHDPLGAVLEHGDIFRNLQHWRFNNH